MTCARSKLYESSKVGRGHSELTLSGFSSDFVVWSVGTAFGDAHFGRLVSTTGNYGYRPVQYDDGAFDEDSPTVSIPNLDSRTLSLFSNIRISRWDSASCRSTTVVTSALLAHGE